MSNRRLFYHHVEYIDDVAKRGCYTSTEGGKLVIAKPLSISGILGFRFRLYKSWLVLTGKADAFKYYEQ